MTIFYIEQYKHYYSYTLFKVSTMPFPPGVRCELALGLQTAWGSHEWASYNYDHCTKHPGHTRFYTLSQLSLATLPHGCQTDGFLSYVR